MKKIQLVTVFACLTATVFPACSTYRESGGSPTDNAFYMSDADATVAKFKSEDPSLDKFFKDAYGYAVFPKVTKGAAGIGAANGKGGVVYERHSHVGYAEMTQVTIGAQLGGQSFSEVVFFQNEYAMNTFKQSNTEFSANASAVIASKGSGAAADYRDGVAVFTMPLTGAMFEASIGGQKFKYWPK